MHSEVLRYLNPALGKLRKLCECSSKNMCELSLL